MEEIVTTNTILKELREFRAENDKRWEENNIKLNDIDLRVKKLENGRETDKQELYRIVDTIGETVKNEFEKMNKKLDIRFSKIEAILNENAMQHKEFKEKIEANESRINLYGVRIQKLEDWKDEFETGTCLPV